MATYLYPITVDKQNVLQDDANEKKQRMMGSSFSTHVLFRVAMSGNRNAVIKPVIPAGFYLFKPTERRDQMFLSYCGLCSPRASSHKSCHEVLRDFLAIAR